MSTPAAPFSLRRSLLLWTAWLQAVLPLRPACHRTTTFLWLLTVLAGLCLRPDLAGVTSIVRSLGLLDATYECLLHFFHSPALDLDLLTRLWAQAIPRLFRRHLVRCQGRLALVVDGLKRPKEGKKMPGVKSLHQESRCNAKASFIMGHSCQAAAILVQVAGYALGVPVACRIHEGVVWSNRDQRSLLTKLAQLILGLGWQETLIVIADAYYYAGRFARRLLAGGHHLITRVHRNGVAYLPPPARRPKGQRGRRRKYGKKIKLGKIFRLRKELFQSAQSPVYGERGVTLRYCSQDLLWRGLGQLTRYVWVMHPTRGRMVLLCTDLTLDPLTILRLYGWRFKIEVGFKQAIHTVGAYAYHFWMRSMTPIRRGSGNQYMHRQSAGYRHRVRRKLLAYERHIQIGLIAQGLLQYLAVRCPRLTRRCFNTYIRTDRLTSAPSEWMVTQALRATWFEFLRFSPCSRILKKFLATKISPKRCPVFEALELDEAA